MSKISKIYCMMRSVANPVGHNQMWNVMPLNYDLFTDYHLNFGCYGYDYYYNTLQELRKCVTYRDTGPCAIYHYKDNGISRFGDDDIWKVFNLQNGLLHGNYLQNGGIESPTLRAEYNQGMLHGYRIIILYGPDRIVCFYNKGMLQFYYRQYRGHVYEYNCKINNKIITIESPKKCIHCIIAKMKKVYKDKHKK